MKIDRISTDRISHKKILTDKNFLTKSTFHIIADVGRQNKILMLGEDVSLITPNYLILVSKPDIETFKIRVKRVRVIESVPLRNSIIFIILILVIFVKIRVKRVRV